MYRFFKILQQDTISLFINPSWLIMGFAFPFSLTVILGLLTEGMYGGEFSSYDYYGVTMMIFSVLNSATFSANCFLEERVKNPNMRIIYSPVPSLFIPLAKIMGTFIFTTVCYTLTGVILSILFGANYGMGVAAIQVWGLFLVLNFFCCCLGVLVCCIFKDEGVANQLISLISALIAIASGLFFPLSSISKQIQKFSEILPLTRVTDTIFQLIYDDHTKAFLPSLIILGILSLISIIFCGYLFKGEDYL